MELELVERYLQAVSKALPKNHQEDITKELRDNILSQVEESEESLGRPLHEDEQVTLLKKLGSPTRLAMRYRNQEHMIGSTVFPIYWKILKLALGLAFLVQAAGSIAMAAAGKPFFESLAVLFNYPNVALSVFGWVTLAFAGLEFFGTKYKGSDRFDPRKLPPLEKAPSTGKSQFELIATLVTQIVFGVWWLAGLHSPYLIMGPGATVLNFGPVWHSIYPLFVILVLLEATRTALKLMRPDWGGQWMLTAVTGVLGIAVLYFLIMANEVFVPANPNSVQLQVLAKTLNSALHLGLMVAAVIRVITLIVAGAKLAGRKFGQAYQATVGM